MSDNVTTAHSSAEVRSLVAGLVAALAGHAAGPRPDLVAMVKRRIAKVALSLVSENLVTLSRGGAGADGTVWDALKPETVARRPTGAGELSGLTRRGAHAGRPFLTMAEDARWRLIFATTKARLVGKYGMGELEAGERAGQAAWATLKREGGKTRLQVLGSRVVDIGRNSGRMLASFSEAPFEPGDQILSVDDAGRLTVGSAVPYAAAFHAKRRLIPDQLPASWGKELAAEAGAAVLDAVAAALAG